MGKDMKISVRVSTEQYYYLYSIYEKYHSACPNLTFSDFIRNLMLSIIAGTEAQHNNENKTEN